MVRNVSPLSMLWQFLNKPADTAPPSSLPSRPTDLSTPAADTPVVVWFGHSSYLIRYRRRTILVDPVLSGHASPVSLLIRAFAGSDIYSVDDMPDIDVMVLTHDHYDHLDYGTIRRLAPRTAMFCTALGVGAHLEYWGVEPEKIVEADWWEQLHPADGVRLTATPARHFSGRVLKRNQTLWSSFVLQLDDYTLFLGGDSGYDTHFADIGSRYGPFDLAVLEIGQYGVNWPLIHSLPEQAVQACRDLNARLLLPVHWAKFTLALHPWNEPIRRATAAAREHGVQIATPMIGEPVPLGGPYPTSEWWEI